MEKKLERAGADRYVMFSNSTTFSRFYSLKSPRKSLSKSIRHKHQRSNTKQVFVGKLRDSMKVAIKVIEVEKEETWVQIRKDDPEIGLMTRCRHPRLVMFLGYGVIPNQGHFIVRIYHCSSVGVRFYVEHHTGTRIHELRESGFKIMAIWPFRRRND